MPGNNDIKIDLSSEWVSEMDSRDTAKWALEKDIVGRKEVLLDILDTLNTSLKSVPRLTPALDKQIISMRQKSEQAYKDTKVASEEWKELTLAGQLRMLYAQDLNLLHIFGSAFMWNESLVKLLDEWRQSGLASKTDLKQKGRFNSTDIERITAAYEALSPLQSKFEQWKQVVVTLGKHNGQNFESGSMEGSIVYCLQLITGCSKEIGYLSSQLSQSYRMMFSSSARQRSEQLAKAQQDLSKCVQDVIDDTDHNSVVNKLLGIKDSMTLAKTACNELLELSSSPSTSRLVKSKLIPLQEKLRGVITSINILSEELDSNKFKPSPTHERSALLRGKHTIVGSWAVEPPTEVVPEPSPSLSNIS